MKEIFDINFEEVDGKKKLRNENISKISQEQLYDLLTSKELSWQAIIYDLIKTEQLDPLNINLSLLAKRYLEKIKELEELGEMGFFISSKVLYAAALLLRIKSHCLRNTLQGIDEILFNRKEKIREDIKVENLVQWEEEDLPLIIPKTPLLRQKRVTLVELMSALERAMTTEQRRIKKEISWRRIQTEIDYVVFPKERKNFDLRQKLKEMYVAIKSFFIKRKDNKEKLTFSMIAGNNKDEKIFTLIPLLHLDSQEKIWLEQEKSFGEIEIFLQEHYLELKKIKELEEQKLIEEQAIENSMKNLQIKEKK